MRFTYETAIATMIQFIIASLFILVSQLGSSVVGCFSDGSDCASNILTSVIFFVVVSIFFGVIWVIGYAAQDRRSRPLARLLIAIEGFLGLLALFSLKLDARSHKIDGFLASLGMLLMAAWIIRLAFRLTRSKGGRVVAHGQRARQRRRNTPTEL